MDNILMYISMLPRAGWRAVTLNLLSGLNLWKEFSRGAEIVSYAGLDGEVVKVANA